jgi:transcriptional regulator with XRE-family HTH domain
MLNLEVGNAELGRSMGVSRQAALNWRTGKSSMTVETLEAIAVEGAGRVPDNGLHVIFEPR